jgi:gamma-glutamylcyclotransferase (GGCT)/AIG2-like uncharacterized protein YtfP
MHRKEAKKIMTNVFFTYGTLKLNECRGGLWERCLGNNFEAKNASVKGLIYDLGAYPAMIPGEGEVFGQAIFVKDKDRIDGLIKTLDRIEGYFGEGNPNNLYNRLTVETKLENGRKVEAIVYFFNDTEYLGLAEPIKSGVWSTHKCMKEKGVV